MATAADGRVLDGRYRLERWVASGGFGDVWRATDEVAEQPPFLVMEFVDGQSLADLLADGPLAMPTTLGIVAQVAAGMAAAHEAGLVHLDLNRQFYLSGNLASMVPGLPYAIGIQRALRGRQVIGYVGDGGFSMLMAELLTAIQHNLPVKIVINNNNNSLGQILWEQMVLGFPEHGVRYPQPYVNYAAFATANGAIGIEVTSARQVGPAIAEAFSEPGPALVDVHVNPRRAATARQGRVQAGQEVLALNVHGNADSHFDALCHVSYDGTFYNDLPVDRAAAAELSVDAIAARGIVGRGVLLDRPRLRGIGWLEPGDHVTASDLTEAERSQGVEPGTGDLLFVRVGHRKRRQEVGPWNVAAARAGLHPQALELLAQRQVALLGSDGNNDTAPSIAEGVDFPVHVLAIRALGLPLLDYLALEDLATACHSLGRWSFLCVIAPLRLPTGTGSPVNPIALF